MVSPPSCRLVFPLWVHVMSLQFPVSRRLGSMASCRVTPCLLRSQFLYYYDCRTPSLLHHRRAGVEFAQLLLIPLNNRDCLLTNQSTDQPANH
ncbi:hypothetical protein BO71DRAFT_399855 [Aspergillus ellipticus CBS 707.79]|uniref:Uncharacterized protein n=1 Tax=Aspergillus ellipticus CBS 707.79 TaxID=1448320 RepID=A0A319D748_9EURO|nr:hypothetical protein BO71DRAFT_399855 [Aspergillus ellipticus CBS 707.79]